VYNTTNNIDDDDDDDDNNNNNNNSKQQINRLNWLRPACAYRQLTASGRWRCTTSNNCSSLVSRQCYTVYYSGSSLE